MSFESLINLRNCRVTRNTDILLESIQITAAPILTRQPAEEVRLSILISGCTTGSGVVIVNGIVSGLPDSETFSFTQNGPKIGTKDFTSITGITTVGFIDEVTVGNIIIKAITPSNQPVEQEIEIFAEMNCWVDFHRGGIQVVLPGAVIQSISKLFCLHIPSIPLQENDFVYYSNIRYKIDFIEPIDSRSETPHHLELGLERLKAE